jgi:hypothetical protein
MTALFVKAGTKEVETILDSSSHVAYFHGADITQPTLIMLL